MFLKSISVGLMSTRDSIKLVIVPIPLSYCHKYPYNLCLLENIRYFCGKIKKVSLIDIQFGEQVYPPLLSRVDIRPTEIDFRNINPGTRGDGSTTVGAISQRAIGNQRQGTRHENLRHTGDG